MNVEQTWRERWGSVFRVWCPDVENTRFVGFMILSACGLPLEVIISVTCCDAETCEQRSIQLRMLSAAAARNDSPGVIFCQQVFSFLITFANVHVSVEVLITITPSNTTPSRQPLFLLEWLWKQAGTHDAGNRFLQMKAPFQQNPLKQSLQQHKVNYLFPLNESSNDQSKACWGIWMVPGVKKSINFFFVFVLIICPLTHAPIHKMLADKYVNRSSTEHAEIIRGFHRILFLVIAKL